MRDKPSTEPVDLANVQTLAELKTAFGMLRGSRTYSALEEAAGKRGKTLPASTLSNLLNGEVTPSRHTVHAFLSGCGLSEADHQPWLAAWERVVTADQRRAPGTVRVRDARARLLGVHAAIKVDQTVSDLPLYVPRDFDTELRTKIREAVDCGGFVLLLGGSSTGKTRALFEAVTSCLSEWWLVRPDPDNADELRELAANPAPRTVVWLDDLEDYRDRLSPSVARKLIASGAVLLGTLWPEDYTGYAASRISGRPGSHPNANQLVRLAHIITVPDDLTTTETRRAKPLAEKDERIRIALHSRDSGFAQVLAAGPALIRWCVQAPAPHSIAVITAALDAFRIGVSPPLTRTFLETAALGYLTGAQKATLHHNWVDQALDYATTLLHGAMSALVPVPAGIGRIDGYTAADYLRYHARQARRTKPVPDSMWQAVIAHRRHPENGHLLLKNNTIELGDSARRRGRADIAEILYQQALTEESPFLLTPAHFASGRLAELMAEQGREDELRSAADAGNLYASQRLAELLTEQGRNTELRQRANLGDVFANQRPTDLLHEQGRTERYTVSDWAEDLMTERGVEGTLSGSLRKSFGGYAARASAAGW